MVCIRLNPAPLRQTGGGGHLTCSGVAHLAPASATSESNPFPSSSSTSVGGEGVTKTPMKFSAYRNNEPERRVLRP